MKKIIIGRIIQQLDSSFKVDFDEMISYNYSLLFLSEKSVKSWLERNSDQHFVLLHHSCSFILCREKNRSLWFREHD